MLISQPLGSVSSFPMKVNPKRFDMSKVRLRGVRSAIWSALDYSVTRRARKGDDLLGSVVLTLLILTASVQAQFSYVTTNGTITITGYAGPCGAVVIPDSINGLA